MSSSQPSDLTSSAIMRHPLALQRNIKYKQNIKVQVKIKHKVKREPQDIVQQMKK